MIITYIHNAKCTPQSFNSSIVYAIVSICQKFITKWMNDGLSTDEMCMLCKLSDALNKMLKMPYNQYMYVSYYISLLKVQNLISTIIFCDYNNREIEMKILQLSLEISNAEFAVYAYLNFCRRHYILYKKFGEEDELSYLHHHWNIVCKLADLIHLKGIDEKRITHLSD